MCCFSFLWDTSVSFKCQCVMFLLCVWRKGKRGLYALRYFVEMCRTRVEFYFAHRQASVCSVLSCSLSITVVTGDQLNGWVFSWTAVISEVCSYSSMQTFVCARNRARVTTAWINGLSNVSYIPYASVVNNGSGNKMLNRETCRAFSRTRQGKCFGRGLFLPAAVNMLYTQLIFVNVRNSNSVWVIIVLRNSEDLSVFAADTAVMFCKATLHMLCHCTVMKLK